MDFALAFNPMTYYIHPTVKGLHLELDISATSRLRRLKVWQHPLSCQSLAVTTFCHYCDSHWNKTFCSNSKRMKHWSDGEMFQSMEKVMIRQTCILNQENLLAGSSRATWRIRCWSNGGTSLRIPFSSTIPRAEDNGNR